MRNQTPPPGSTSPVPTPSPGAGDRATLQGLAPLPSPVLPCWGDPEAWERATHSAREQGAVLRAWLPSHVPTIFEALTGAWGGFEAAIGRIEAAISGGVRVELVHTVSEATLRPLVDLMRFVDDRLRAVEGLWLTADAERTAAALPDFQPWWRSAVSTAAARELRVQIDRDSGLPGIDPNAWRPPERRAPSTHGVREQVGLHPRPAQGGDSAAALQALLAGVGTLARFVRPSQVAFSVEEMRLHLSRHPRDRERAQRERMAMGGAAATPSGESERASWPRVLVRLMVGTDGAAPGQQGPRPALLGALLDGALALQTRPEVLICGPDGAVPTDAPQPFASPWRSLCATRGVPVHLAAAGERRDEAEEPAFFAFSVCLATVSAAPSTGHEAGPRGASAATAIGLPDTAHAARMAQVEALFAQAPLPHPQAWTLALPQAAPQGERFDRRLTPPGSWLPHLFASQALAAGAPAGFRLSNGGWLPLAEVLRTDLWICEAPALDLLLAGTDPVPIDHWLFDALQPHAPAPRWLQAAREADCPYAQDEGADIGGHCRPEVVDRGPPRVSVGRGRPLTILGLACTTLQNHGAALLQDGRIVAAVQEERLRRRKQVGWHPPGRRTATVVSDPTIALQECYPWRSIHSVLGAAGIGMEDVDVIAFNGIPVRHFSTYSLTDPARPPQTIWRGRHAFIPHHLAHAASAWRVAGMPEALVLTVDGRGERETAAFFEPDGGRLRRRFDVLALGDGAIGGVYESATMVLGFGRYGQGSTMGLAAMGRQHGGGPGTGARPASGWDMDMTPYLSVRRHDDVTIHEHAIQQVFAGLTRHRDGPLYDEHFALAAAVQEALERSVIALIEEGFDGRAIRQLCLAGGAALNCSMNSRIRAHFGLDRVFVQPAATDGGTALGAALEAHFELTGEAAPEEMAHACLGPQYGQERVVAALQAFGLPVDRRADIATEAAELIAGGAVVCWFQGRLEFGPRALGARSILADPRSPEIKDRLNVMKGRQWWRPLGPSILEGREADWFEAPMSSPFMLFSLAVRPERQSEIPAVMHFDGTTRPQSVSASARPRLHALLTHFERLTGVPMVINTSFNTAFEPIVCTPEDGIASFLQLGADYLAIGDHLVARADLPAQGRSH